ncbi:hypothetical protein ASF60_18990 [Methylobacterium sp. Leaf113]|nr:hypothetical protein ASF60_18990 [Methylobacterium sp. Leaf113]
MARSDVITASKFEEHGSPLAGALDVKHVCSNFPSKPAEAFSLALNFSEECISTLIGQKSHSVDAFNGGQIQ